MNGPIISLTITRYFIQVFVLAYYLLRTGMYHAKIPPAKYLQHCLPMHHTKVLYFRQTSNTPVAPAFFFLQNCNEKCFPRHTDLSV